MTTSYNNLLGKRFGRLVVTEMLPYRLNGNIAWSCKCDCGNTAVVRSSDLMKGNTKSCGCYKIDALKSREWSDQSRQKLSRSKKEMPDNILKSLGYQDDTDIAKVRKGYKERKANSGNSGTGVRNVYKHKDGSKYFVSINFRKKTYSKFGFNSLEEAIKYRDKIYEKVIKPYLDKVSKEEI